MDEAVRRALATDRTVDITTVGRRSGAPRRIETWVYRADGRFFLSGAPGRRDWQANLRAHPSFTFHLKRSVRADLGATAVPVTDERERRRVLTEILGDLGQPADLDAWMAGSPLLEIRFEDGPSAVDPLAARE
jgi:deazaflavin-dependent oxidoreductase (nitroreductase family)